MAASLLRRHVSHGSQNQARVGFADATVTLVFDSSPLGARELGQAKIEDFDESIVRDHQVLGL